MNLNDKNLMLRSAKILSRDKKQEKRIERKEVFMHTVSKRLPPIAIKQTSRETSEGLKLTHVRLSARQKNKHSIDQKDLGKNCKRCESLLTETEPFRDYVQPCPVSSRTNLDFLTTSMSTTSRRSQQSLNSGQLEKKAMLKSETDNLPQLKTIKSAENTEKDRWITFPFKRFLRRSGCYEQYSVINSDEEMLGLEKHMQDMLVTTKNEKQHEILDFSGRVVASSSAFNENECALQMTSSESISRYEKVFARNSYQSCSNISFGSSSASKGSAAPLSQLTIEEKRQMQKRFYKVLDEHFSNQYRENYQRRRNAICEELEKGIFYKGVNLRMSRETIRLQWVLESWML